jgi:hypothetical protein
MKFRYTKINGLTKTMEQLGLLAKQVLFTRQQKDMMASVYKRTLSINSYTGIGCL